MKTLLIAITLLITTTDTCNVFFYYSETQSNIRVEFYRSQGKITMQRTYVDNKEYTEIVRLGNKPSFKDAVVVAKMYNLPCKNDEVQLPKNRIKKITTWIK